MIIRMRNDMPWQDIQRIRAESPLVHNITNYVVMNTTANALSCHRRLARHGTCH